MSKNKEWDNFIDQFFDILDRTGCPAGFLANKMFDALAAEDGIRLSPNEETTKKAHFVWSVGVDLYERKRFSDAIDSLMTAAKLYESVHGKEQNEGLYKCYGYITYCYSEMKDIENTQLWTNKTLEIEKLVRGYRDSALSSESLEGRNDDFRWKG